MRLKIGIVLVLASGLAVTMTGAAQQNEDGGQKAGQLQAKQVTLIHCGTPKRCLTTSNIARMPFASAPLRRPGFGRSVHAGMSKCAQHFEFETKRSRNSAAVMAPASAYSGALLTSAIELSIAES